MKAYWFNLSDSVCGATDDHRNIVDLKYEIISLLQNDGAWKSFGEPGDKIEIVDETGD